MTIQPANLPRKSHRSMKMLRPVQSHVVLSPTPAALAAQRFATVAVISTFMVSIYLYKAWYIAAMAALVVTVGLIVLDRLRYRGLFGALVPLSFYFLWLVTTALWATYPGDAVWFGSAASIGIVIAALFYLLALNQPHRITGVFLAFAWISVPITAWTFWRSPEASRTGGYAIAVLPFVPAFCWSEIARGRRTTLATLTLVVTFGLLIFARSRTPIGVAIFTTAIAIFTFSKGILTLIRRGIIALAAIALTFGGLVYFEPTREIALITFSRFTHISVRVGDVYVEADPPVDVVRGDLHKAARQYGREYLFFGMGYRNFPKYFARDWSPISKPYTLHSMYETWWVEGGLVCLLTVFIVFHRHFRSLVRAMRCSVDAEVRRLARVMIVASLGIFLFGLFHQTHDNPLMYALIGIGAALPRSASLARHCMGRSHLKQSSV